MTARQKVEAVIADAREHGYESHFPGCIADAFLALADAIDGTSGSGGVAVEKGLESPPVPPPPPLEHAAGVAAPAERD